MTLLTSRSCTSAFTFFEVSGEGELWDASLINVARKFLHFFTFSCISWKNKQKKSDLNKRCRYKNWLLFDHDFYLILCQDGMRTLRTTHLQHRWNLKIMLYKAWTTTQRCQGDVPNSYLREAGDSRGRCSGCRDSGWGFEESLIRSLNTSSGCDHSGAAGLLSSACRHQWGLLTQQHNPYIITLRLMWCSRYVST